MSWAASLGAADGVLWIGKSSLLESRRLLRLSYVGVAIEVRVYVLARVSARVGYREALATLYQL